MEDLLTNDLLIKMVGIVAMLIVSAVQATTWYQRICIGRKKKAVDAVLAGVQHTYDVYTKSIKEGRQDGTLTAEEKAKARQLAKEAAIEFGRTQGVDVIKSIGEEFIDFYIARSVKALKSPKAPKAPKS